MAEGKEKSEAPVKGAEETGAKTAGGSKKKTAIIAGILVADILIMGAVAFFIAARLRAPNPAAEAQKTQEEAERKAREERTRIGMTLPKPLTFTVNIGPNGDHYLKCSIQLEWETDAPPVAGKGEKGGEGGGGGLTDPVGKEIEERMPKISDIIINILSSEPYEELLRPAGKQKMKESIVSEVNAILPDDHGHLRNAFFTDFLVQ